MMEIIKKDVIDHYQNGFVDQFEEHSGRMMIINKAISHVCPGDIYEYNGYCKAVLKSVEKTLSNDIDYGSLVINKEQLLETLKSFSNIKEDVDKKIGEMLFKKFTDNLLLKINENILLNLIEFKLPKESFERVKPILMMSLKISGAIAKDSNEGLDWILFL